MSWKKLGSKILLSHPRLEVYEDKIVLPNGDESTYVHFGKPKDAATVIAVDGDNKIFIQKEYSYPPDGWLFQFPGGGVEDGETVKQTAERELAEEGGLGGELVPLGSFLLDNRRSAQRMHVFAATGLYEREAEDDPEEEFEDFWFEPAEVDDLISEGELCITSALSAWAIFKARLPEYFD